MNHSEKNFVSDTPRVTIGSANQATKVPTMPQLHDLGEPADRYASIDLNLDLSEIYFLIMHFISTGPCKKTFRQMYTELQEHQLLPRRYHAWYSRDGADCREESRDGNSLPLNYDDLVGRYPHIRKDHLVWLLKELMSMISPPLRCSTQSTGENAPSATDVPTLLGSGSFSLLSYDRNKGNKWMRKPHCYLHWPHRQADQVRGLSLREIGGGFPRHHRAPSIRLACYTIAKPSSMVLKMQNMKKLRGHRNAVYCAIFDRTGRHVITGSDDRLVKIWSMETALCLASCRGHEGDITDLSVSSNNAVVASASNDFTIRVWRLPDGYPISVLRGHTGAVTAIAFSPSSRPSSFYQILSSSDDGTCRIWDARYSDSCPRVYMPKPNDAAIATGSGFLSASAPSNTTPSHQILFCAYNANGTAFVTGSSDTFARVWSACKPSIHEPSQPIHEMDILAGHENNVNYVQFSGCAVGLRSSPSDCCTEDGIPKFKNSWFNHDSIVTCSRDGSAIIWVPKLRRSHGKVARWVRSYHLKVPPPPMPPRPARGGPCQRFLPTPRGVNMIVWSLDNRFVLAAIMDNRICVWNAIDGSLVHSLAGHTASTYVLDVHPFNPRIALSAGYDGKTILWDIWEGTPAKVYNLGGCVKLVDGKFSQDGTSIVLSDDLGQIYLINTGEGESYKDAQYDQFFLGDYRPLTQDTHGNVVDQETQLSPYLRNIQDTLCDSSMLPYPEPYQTMYQRRRLGALGIEWRPSHIKFATGTDTGMGQDIPLPLPDLDVVEPLPDYGDAIFWEPENDAINDDNDSEYNANEEVYSEELNKCSDNTSGSECSEGDNDKQTQKDYTRRSKRRKYAGEVESTSGIRTKNRNKDGKDGTSSRATTYTKSKLVLRSSGTQPSKLKSLRPQRAAARSAVSSFSDSAETSLDEEEDEFSMSESDSDLSLEDEERSEYLANKRSFGAVRSAPNGFEDLNSLRQPGRQISGGNQKRLVFKFSRNQKSAPMSSDNRVDQVTEPSSSLWSCEDNLVQKIVDSGSRNLDSSSASMHGKEPLENCRRRTEDEERTLLDRNQCIASTSSGVANVRWGKIKIRMPNSSISGASIPVESTTKTSDTCQPTWVEDNVSSAVSAHCGEQLKDDDSAIIGHTFDRSTGSPSNHDGIKLHIVDKHSSQMSNSAQKKRNVIKIKLTKFSGGTTSQFKPKATSGSGSDVAMERQAASLTRSSSELLDTATDLANRSTLHKKKCTKQDFGLAANNLDSQDDHLKSNTCIDREMFVKDDDCFLSEGSNRGDYNCRESSYFVETNKHVMPGKSNWLSLTGQEGGYRYIPQLGDQVVYLKQGHKDFIVRTQPTQHDNGLSYGDSLRAVEACSVDDLEYASHTGSGESCCQITLKLIDPKCRVYGKKIQLTLPELDDFPDFIVEKMWYDATMERNWSVGEKCLVWWRDNTEQAGSWWEGQITAIKDKDSKFPGSPWERYLVQYETDAEIHHHSPWELHGSEGQWEQPTIDSKIKESILSSFNKLFRRAYNNKDSYGVVKLNEASLKMDFVNRFPVPLSLDVIKTRLENDYYRSITALKHDFKVMMSNAESYFHKNPGVLRKIKDLEAWFSEIFTLL